MSVYRRGTVYWYHFVFEGEHVQRPTKVRTRNQAQKMEAIHKANLALGKYGLAKKENPKFSEFAARYLEYSKANKPAYVVEKYYVPKALAPFFGRYRLNEITALTVEKYKQDRLKRGLKKSSINRELGLLKSMLSTAVKWQLTDQNGAREAKLFKLDEPTVDRVLSYEEEAKLLKACEDLELQYRAPHLKPVIIVALYTGLRRGEILRLRWTDIDFENTVLVVRKSKSKAGRGRLVYLNTDLKKLLLWLRQGTEGPWVFPSPKCPGEHVSDVKHSFSRAVKLAGIPHFTMHCLRHTFCTRLADAGVPLPVIQELAGHASILMTRRYTHPANELKQKAVELLLQGRQEPAPATKPATADVTPANADVQEKLQTLLEESVTATGGSTLIQ